MHKKLKQRFKDAGLKWKILSIYIVMLLLPLILVGYVIYYGVSSSIEKKIDYSAQTSYEQVKSYLEYKLSDYIKMMDSIALNDLFAEEIIRAGYLDNVHKQLAEIEVISSALEAAEDVSGKIQFMIYIPDSSGLQFYNARVRPLSELESMGWYKDALEKIFWIPESASRRADRIILVRNIFSKSNYRDRIAVLCMIIDSNEFVDILQNSPPTQDTLAYIINSKNEIIACTDKAQYSALNLGMGNNSLSYSSTEYNSKLKAVDLGTKEFRCIKTRIDNTDWELVMVIPYSDMTEGILRVQVLVVGVLLIFGVFTYISELIIISWTSKRLQHLLDAFQRVQNGDITVEIEKDANDEIGRIYENFNRMLKRIRELIAEKVNLGISLKNAEMRTLQAQINPHFLYNTLDMINWMSFSHCYEDIHRVVVALSKYYRLTLSQGKDMHSLREELDHVGYYVQIQQMRYPGKLQYECTATSEAEKCIVPNIILQPIIENAIRHGIWERDDKTGKVSITAWIEQGDLMIIICDDGVGMNSLQCEALRSQFHLSSTEADRDTSYFREAKISENSSTIPCEQKKDADGGYGLFNIQKRIKILYGEKYGIRFDSEIGHGTKVLMKIPAVLS